MVYVLNGKNIKIPDNELINIQNGLQVSKDEAIQIYLEDNDYLENVEQVALDKKAKDSKITATIHKAQSGKERKKVTRERKPDLEKEKIINDLKDFLTEKGMQKVEITNKSKIIEFNIGGNHYKLDLIKTRTKKV